MQRLLLAPDRSFLFKTLRFDGSTLIYFCLFVFATSRGHGTYVDEEKLTASVAGEVQRVDKLICVRPLKTR